MVRPPITLRRILASLRGEEIIVLSDFSSEDVYVLGGELDVDEFGITFLKRIREGSPVDWFVRLRLLPVLKTHFKRTADPLPAVVILRRRLFSLPNVTIATRQVVGREGQMMTAEVVVVSCPLD